mgnify:CR=1 FL=1
MKKIVLGTAQFGLDYGIANKRGKVPKKEVFDILDYAWDKGIRFLDTAYLYGESEKLIGEFKLLCSKSFNVISKFPRGKNGITEILKVSLNRLNTHSIYGYIAHRVKDFLEGGFKWDEVEQLKRQGLVEKIGFSLYYPDELEYLFKREVDFDIVQVPYSVFDRRFEPYFEILAKKGVDIYVRSVFLQGLFFLSIEELPEMLRPAKKYLLKLENISSNTGISISQICIGFVLLNKYIKGVVLGVDSLDNLLENIEAFSNFNRSKIEKIKSDLLEVYIDDEDIIIPVSYTHLTLPTN